MNIQNTFHTPNGRAIKFLRKHPSQNFAGKPGVFALTVENNFSIRPLTFEAANDLGCLNEPVIRMHPLYSAYRSQGTVGVCVCILPFSDEEYRNRLANDLNAGIISPAAA